MVADMVGHRHRRRLARYAVRAQAAYRDQGLRRAGVMIKFLVGFIVVAAAVLAGFSWLSLHWSYSDGERAGFVQKFSRRGWICKTWEGELAMVTLPGTMTEKFAFTVRDPQVAN